MKSWQLPTIVFLLVLVGSLTIQSLVPELLVKHLIFLVIGWLLFFISANTKFQIWKELATPTLIIWFVLLFLVLLLPNDKTTARWLDFGPILFQPSQLFLPVLGLFFSQKLKKANLNHFKSLWSFILITGLSLFLIMIEPDFGTMATFLATIGLTLMMLGLHKKILFQGLLLIIFGGIISWFLILQPYQKQRLFSFFSPQNSSSASNYNAKQAIISVGSGGLFGAGLGKGTQSQLKFLPERHTDFIFAAISEETGLIGGLLIIGLYNWLIFALIHQSKNLRFDRKILVVLTATWLTIQPTINIGMNIGLLPITGLTLPLISYGGSSLISTMFLFGLVQSAINSQKIDANIHLT